MLSGVPFFAGLKYRLGRVSVVGEKRGRGGLSVLAPGRSSARCDDIYCSPNDAGHIWRCRLVS